MLHNITNIYNIIIFFANEEVNCSTAMITQKNETVD